MAAKRNHPQPVIPREAIYIAPIAQAREVKLENRRRNAVFTDL
jgi:hypothetical protein